MKKFVSQQFSRNFVARCSIGPLEWNERNEWNRTWDRGSIIEVSLTQIKRQCTDKDRATLRANYRLFPLFSAVLIFRIPLSLYSRNARARPTFLINFSTLISKLHWLLYGNLMILGRMRFDGNVITPLRVWFHLDARRVSLKQSRVSPYSLRIFSLLINLFAKKKKKKKQKKERRSRSCARLFRDTHVRAKFTRNYEHSNNCSG